MASKPRKSEYTEFESEIDVQEFKDSIINYFSSIPDPREHKKSVYRLEHIFFIILSATLAGANSINQIAIFSQAKARWIRDLIGISTTPQYGVFWWILVRLKPEFLRELLKGWLAGLPEKLREEILAIDGKCLRGTQSGNTLNPALHLVSLFAVNSGLVIAQQPVDEKSNEITAIPKLLDGTDIQGAIVTIDAMGCQKKIAKQICDAGADYVLALKGNAGCIHDEIVGYFSEAKEAGYEYLEHTHHSKEDASHGRVVLRSIRCVQDIEWLPQLKEWEKLKGFIEVVSHRTEKGKKSREHRYYITSLEADAEKLARIIRSHWGIENNLHRQLDVNFMEDASPVNTGHAAENLGIFRRMALNILGAGKGLLERRRRAAWNEDYLTELVEKFFIKSF
jgi:predicted transposase YbfD/YdcC